MNVGIDWNGRFGHWARTLRPLLPQDVGSRLVSLVEAIPPDNSLLHGDLHVANMVVCGESDSIIDMEFAGFGHPVLDLAITRSHTVLNAQRRAQLSGSDEGKAASIALSYWNAHLESYFGGEVPVDPEEVERVATVLSYVESCCFTYGMRSKERMAEWRKEQLARTASLLEEQLPQLERLYF